jgi:hypothetical protein
MHIPQLARRFMLALAVGLASAGCASVEPPAPLVNVPVTLAVGASASLRPGLSISFDSVKDSRCPQNVQCIWAGQLLYLLTLHGRTQEAFTLSDKAPGHTSASGVSVVLNTDKPPPRPVAGQPAPSYTVMLLINSN